MSDDAQCRNPWLRQAITRLGQVIGQVLHRQAIFFGRLTFRGSVAISLLIGAFYASYVLYSVRSDFARFFGVAFGALVALGALAFSCARSLAPDDEARDRFVYAGERFFHAAVLTLLASLLKYAIAATKSHEGVALRFPLFVAVVDALFGFAAFGLFFTAVLSAHTGVSVVSRLLVRRALRYPEWDDLC